ncbi:MAG: GAF domain-containing protein [Actinomycetota bacterium]|nr:GAF domain-containing protein [Actinomycetota bacterium]
MLDEAVRCVAQELSVPLAEVLELCSDGERLLCAAGLGFEGLDGLEVGTGLASQAGYTLMAKQPVVVRNRGDEGRFEPCERLRRAGSESGITAKIHRGGALYGVLGAYDREVRAFAPEEVGFLQDVAEALGLAIGGALEREGRERALEEVRERALEHLSGRELISRVCASLAACRTAEAALRTAAGLVAGSVLGDWCLVDVLEEAEEPYEEPKVVRAAVAGPVADSEEQRRFAEGLGRRSLPLDAGACGGPHRVLATGEPELVPRLTEEYIRACAPSKDALGHMRGIQAKSYICVPLRARGRLVGAMALATVGEGRVYDDSKLALAVDLARPVALFVDQHRKEALEVVRERGRAPVVEGEGAVAADAAVTRASGRPSLTRRQQEVLELMREGLTEQQMAEKLHVTKNTVHSHVVRIYSTLGAKSRAEAVVTAQRIGLL